PVIPPGTYTVSASLSGCTKAERTNIRVALGGTATVPVTLAVSVKEEVVVTGEAPVVDTTKAVVGAATSLDTIQKLPLGRNFVSIATTVAGTGVSAGGGLAVYGATGLENQYIIDGVNTTGIKLGDQGKVLNQEFVQEVEVKTGGYEAEYSRALGGIINVVTKSGGNEFHGDVFGYYDSESLAASDKRTDDKALVGVGEFAAPDRLDIGADLGGYFLKDRIWFFAAYDRVQRDDDAEYNYGRTYSSAGIVTANDFRSQTDETRSNLYSGKLTFRLGESNTIALTAFGDPGTYTGALTATTGPESARNGSQDFGGTDYSAKWDGIFGTQFLVQAQYGRHSEEFTDNPQSTALAYNTVRSGLRNYMPGSGIPLYTKEEYNRDAFKLSGTAFFGTHEIKLGADYESINSDYFQAYGGGALVTDFLSASGSYQETAVRYYAKVVGSGPNCNARYDANGNLVTGSFGTPGPGNPYGILTIQDCAGYDVNPAVENPPKTRNLGIFLQDSWKVLNNLTVNVGIRYDEQKLKDANGVDRISLDSEWSPRVGVVWDFTNNGKSKLYANYGRYYTVIPQDIQTRALGNEYTVFAYNYSGGGVLDPVDSVYGYAYIQGGQITREGLKGMYQDEIIAGVEYEVVKNWSVGLKGIYKALGRTIEDRCDLTDPRLPYLAQYIPAGSLTTCALVNYGSSNEDLEKVVDITNPECVAADGTYTGNCETTHIKRFYRGIELTATHRFSNNFYVLANYVYSSLKGNYDGNEKQSTGQQDPNINADFDYIDMVPNNYGRLSLDRPHLFKISGTYSFPFGLTAGANFRYASGAPLAVRGYARPGYTSELYLSPNRGELGDQPDTYEMDFHLEYNLRLGPVTITPIVDVFNLLNRQGSTGQSGVFNTRRDGNRFGVFNRFNDPNYRTSARIDDAACAANPSYTNRACATSANYLRDVGWQNPLQLRLGARVSF
ncbi:hypothetical protein FBQ97_14780, partial [Acidobacteria bacterium ACD]|nr:hypothetical protein [Acidobacteria bacterium ACD]